MRVAVMGAGSIGGYFGGMLSLGGNEVTLIARGAHLDVIRKKGLQIITDNGRFTVQCEATDDPRRVEPVDLVLLTVKTYHNEQAVPTMRSMVGDDTTAAAQSNRRCRGKTRPPHL